MLTSVEIRKQFLNFFKEKGHVILPSAPIVIKNDPSLLFTNAGMNQFKDYFLGNRPAPYPRVADTQKCLRVSGKHNDLEEVGVDTYHHTMFEMLGNWSFGDYFKKEAIEWSWELLTSVYKIPKERLYVTVFEGDSAENIEADHEAISIWKTLVDEKRILMGNKKDNFWEMGDTGPCGPCTEIHVDCRTEEEINQVPGNQLVNQDHPQVIEIWNNVFIQFNRKKDGSLEHLPSTHVDTGMGFERLVRVLQEKQSNYDTDVFSGTIAETEKLSDQKYEGSDSKKDVAFRVIADHIRAIAFPIADGQLPSNTGAGYVIRRILRRAVRYYFSYLEVKQPLLYRLMPLLAEQFADVFPELKAQLDFVIKVVQEEETNFLRTLDAGLKRLDLLKNSARNKLIGGKELFELFDTFGFPLDLTRLIASEYNLEIDEEGFNKEMQAQKDRSRKAAAQDTGDWVILREGQGSAFKGYEENETDSKLLRYRKIKAKDKESYQLVLDQTPFYAESGGQAGDTGTFMFGDEEISITDTRKEGDLIIHFADKLPNNTGDPFKARVNRQKRKSTANHHSATHLLHAALRKVLGTHVAQKGSLVNDTYLRFDFSHFAKVSADEIRQVERLVNEKIRENIPVEINILPKEKALELGAMALFGEKYGDKVRVVMMDPSYSIELCGGTHVRSTGELGFFKIRHESAIAAGVRRIEAVCGLAAENYVSEELELLAEVKEQLKNPADLVKGIENLVAGNSELQKQVQKMEAGLLANIKNELLGKVESFELPSGSKGQFIGQVVEVSQAESLKKICFDLKTDLDHYVILLAANIAGKAHTALMLADSILEEKGWEAPKLTKEYLAPIIKGGGGGQKTLATAGGQDASNLRAAIARIREVVME